MSIVCVYITNYSGRRNVNSLTGLQGIGGNTLIAATGQVGTASEMADDKDPHHTSMKAYK